MRRPRRPRRPRPASGRLDVDLAGQLRIAGAGGIADDGREVDDRLGSVERLPARVGVADVADDQLGASLLEVFGDTFLSVQEAVEDPCLAAGVEQRAHHLGAYISGAAGYQGGTAHRLFLSLVSVLFGRMPREA